MKWRLEAFSPRSLLKRSAWLFAIAWTAIFVFFVVMIGLAERKEVFEVAGSQALALFQKDVVYRLWNSEQGGVYVPVSKKTPPNPYLDGIPGRDVTTTSGKQLTLVNPAYMTRMVHELGLKKINVQGHITSLKPLRPENAADAWETAALKRFEQGKTNVSEIVTLDGVRSFRFMGALVTMEQCLKCHQQQGYRVGDIRGGISVAVPLDTAWAQDKHKNNIMLITGLGCVWLLGITGIVAFGHWSRIRDKERKQAEESLREREFWLSKCQRVARLGSYVLDFKTGFWTSTDVFDEIFGIGPDYTRNVEGWLNLVHPENVAELKAYFHDEVVAQKKSFSKNYRILRASDKGERWVMGAGELVFGADGSLLNMFGTIQDITDLKHLEDQLRQSQKMESVGRLAGGIAHDFNNILTSIIINAGLLQRDAELRPDVKSSIKDIEVEAKRAASLTQQLLMFSRRQVFQIKPLDLNRVLRDLKSMLGRLLGGHIVLELHEMPNLPLIDADAGMMEQVVMNLSVNARDAMPNGGRLTISTSVVEFDQAAVRAKPEAQLGRFVCLQVIDTGCGMDEATCKHLFEPFFTTKEFGKGTGLGLATVYGIVKQHKGWTDVESAPGQGSSFRTFLPVSSVSAVAEAHSPVHIDPRAGHETILLVEDELEVRRMVAKCLRGSGYTVLEASNGVEALVLWSKEHGKIDLLFSDMMMPEGITGMELAARLKEENSSLKVIISSGYSLEMTDHGVPPDRGITFLSKPYPITKLVAVVRRIFEETAKV